MRIILKYSHFLLSTLALVLTVTCILQIISMTQEKHLARQYQREASVAYEEMFSLSAPENSLSLQRVEEKAKKRNFVNGGSVTYLRVSPMEVVSK